MIFDKSVSISGNCVHRPDYCHMQLWCTIIPWDAALRPEECTGGEGDHKTCKKSDVVPTLALGGNYKQQKRDTPVQPGPSVRSHRHL